jgi:hypothetical protein
MSRIWIFPLIVLLMLTGGAAAPGPAGPAVTAPRFVVPDVPDLTITRRRSFDRQDSTITTEIVRLKGAWQRREWIFDLPPRLQTANRHGEIAITRCDERRTLILNERARTFASMPIEDMAERLRWLRFTARRRPQPVQTGPEVTITVDSVDTGERRQVGPYTARHVITTNTTRPAPGAKTRPGDTVTAGWYIDLPSQNCWEWEWGNGFVTATTIGSVAPDHVRVERRGTAARGFPIEEVSQSNSDGATTTTRVELLEFSEARLDTSLFNAPQGYQPALPLLTGGFDLARPDTLTNRLQNYWDDLRSWAQYMFRF